MNLGEQRPSAAAVKNDMTLSFRHPEKSDGARVWRLINECPPLDANSLYCNLLQCTHFSNTCVLAERNQKAVGWVSGYKPPGDPETLFIWQVTVHESARGEGLGKTMINALIADPKAGAVKRIQTTITKDNEASWALFKSIAAALEADFAETPWFDRDREFEGAHATEHLVTIGPFEKIKQRAPKLS